MDNETDLIYPESSAPKSTATDKIKTALWKVFSYLLLHVGIVIIGVIAVPTVILIIVIMGLWSFLDRILSIPEQKKKAQTVHEKYFDSSKKIKDAEENKV